MSNLFYHIFKWELRNITSVVIMLMNSENEVVYYYQFTITCLKNIVICSNDIRLNEVEWKPKLSELNTFQILFVELKKICKFVFSLRF